MTVTSIPYEPILGFFGAIVSTISLQLAQSMPLPEPAHSWVQLGGTVGLIGFLSYACVTLWKTLQATRSETTLAVQQAAERAAEAVRAAEDRMALERAAFVKSKDELEKEIRTDWKNQNDQLINVLNRLDPDYPIKGH